MFFVGTVDAAALFLLVVVVEVAVGIVVIDVAVVFGVVVVAIGIAVVAVVVVIDCCPTCESLLGFTADHVVVGVECVCSCHRCGCCC